MAQLDLMDQKVTVVPMALLEDLDPKDHQALREIEENKDLLDHVENQDCRDLVDHRAMLEMPARMVILEWQVQLEPLVIKELGDHQDFQERPVLMESPEPLVSLVAVEKRDPRECRDRPALQVSLDLSD